MTNMKWNVSSRSKLRRRQHGFSESVILLCTIFCWENWVSKIPFSNPFLPKNARIDRIVNLKNSNVDLIQRIHSRCGFYGFMIRFWICLRNTPSVKLLTKYVIEDVYKTWTPGTPLDLNHGPLVVRSLSAKYRPDRYRRDKSVKFGTELP